MEKISQIENKEMIPKYNMFSISLDKNKRSYIVRLMRLQGKPVIYKEFSYRGDDNQKEALKKALKFRNQKCCELLIPCQRKREGINLQNNKTGVEGVYRRKNDEGYVATWYKDDKLQRMQFSGKKWGEKQAFFMAWATRLLKQKIFVKNKNTKEHIINPKKCFNIVQENYESMETPDSVWDKEKERIRAT